MTKHTKLITRTNLDPDKVGNAVTGETFSTEHPGAQVKLHKDTGLTSMDYNSFTITNDEAIVVIRDHYSHPEISRIVLMTSMVNDKSNVLKQQDNVPHSTETLMDTLGYNRGVFYIFLRKLIWHDIVHITIRNIDRRIIKTIVLNPHIARRSKIQLELADTFRDISKGLDTIILEELPKFPTKVNSK